MLVNFLGNACKTIDVGSFLVSNNWLVMWVYSVASGKLAAFRDALSVVTWRQTKELNRRRGWILPKNCFITAQLFAHKHRLFNINNSTNTKNFI